MATPPSATLPVTLNDLSLVLNEMGLTGSVSAAELFHRLSMRMAPDLIPDILVIHANALKAALANLNVTDITATQLLDAIKKENPSIPDQKNTVPELKSPPQFPDGFPPPYESTVIMEYVDREERARRLERRDHFRKHFSGGMITNPYHDAWLKQFDSAETKDPHIPPSLVPDSTNRYQSSTQDTDR